ncbi:sporulation protein Cse60 [Scopulibacillus cellulosilyticus]|uniref:Sporulation protein Cse60 n=1 Tax=Scopulibacillus cellulosilyticus TaxID=2665665 RepID=A0ABW2PZ53_9BACL
MLKVKLFDEEHEKDLESEINSFLETIDSKKVKDIRYQVAVAEDTKDDGTIFCFSALVIYEI